MRGFGAGLMLGSTAMTIYNPTAPLFTWFTMFFGGFLLVAVGQVVKTSGKRIGAEHRA